jgi:hypothetical protein
MKDDSRGGAQLAGFAGRLDRGVPTGRPPWLGLPSPVLRRGGRWIGGTLIVVGDRGHLAGNQVNGSPLCRPAMQRGIGIMSPYFPLFPYFPYFLFLLFPPISPVPPNLLDPFHRQQVVARVQGDLCRPARF